LREVDANIKIVGGIDATPFSWPSQVLIIRKIEGEYNIIKSDGSVVKRKISEEYMCGGTLINSYTVLTAAHCVSPSFTYSLSGTDVELTVQTNSKFPTFESMITLYLGVYNKNFLDYGKPVPANVVKATVSKMIRVKLDQYLNNTIHSVFYSIRNLIQIVC
jgi:secreted trypsin-like serine protease